MALAVLGVAVGAVAHLTGQAMKKPVTPQDLPYEQGPILATTTLLQASPYGNTSRALVTAGLANVAHLPTGANQAETMQNLTQKLAALNAQQQVTNRMWLGNADESSVLVLPSQTFTQVVTDASNIQHAATQRKYGIPSTSSVLMNGVVSGTQTGAALWARPN